jgi:putative oxidoreductase
LFHYEYMVLFLSPAIAASISVIIEIGVSALLILGLGGRITALILFLFNIMAVVSYPILRTPAGYVGLKDHICWGVSVSANTSF